MVAKYYFSYVRSKHVRGRMASGDDVSPLASLLFTCEVSKIIGRHASPLYFIYKVAKISTTACCG